MSTFDYFSSVLTCTSCGQACDSISSNMQTKIRLRPSLSELSVGDHLEVDWQDICSAGYLKVSEPSAVNTISLLETWECPNCGKIFNWALVEINNGNIQSIREIELSLENLGKANYISEECRYTLNTPVDYDSTVEELISSLRRVN